MSERVSESHRVAASGVCACACVCVCACACVQVRRCEREIRVKKVILKSWDFRGCMISDWGATSPSFPFRSFVLLLFQLLSHKHTEDRVGAA